MFYYINGTVTELEPNLAVLDCGGVGFALNVTMNTVGRLKKNESAKLYTYPVIREDCFDLYGFWDLSEKRCFEMLIGVSGVGPKAALSILSAGTPESLAMAIINNDEKALTVAPGIGKKIAQRVILELKDKISKETQGMQIGIAAGMPVSVGGTTPKLRDAAAALTVLGYGTADINAVLKVIDVENLSLEDIIRQALKNLS